jgi:hypothetical protein
MANPYDLRWQLFKKPGVLEQGNAMAIWHENC